MILTPSYNLCIVFQISESFESIYLANFLWKPAFHVLVAEHSHWLQWRVSIWHVHPQFACPDSTLCSVNKYPLNEAMSAKFDWLIRTQWFEEAGTLETQRFMTICLGLSLACQTALPPVGPNILQLTDKWKLKEWQTNQNFLGRIN